MARSATNKAKRSVKAKAGNAVAAGKAKGKADRKAAATKLASIRGKVGAAKSKARGKAKATPAREYVQKPGTGFTFADTDRLTVLVKTNPKRGASAERFEAYLKRKPKTVAAALEAGLTRSDIRWDHGKGFIRVG